ncbi:MAG: T9SS type A sorting domain-containing protein [Thermotogae bacterium]|nr:T9SS type A sorting domain-containing protein [Thermotogota bacterium]
MLWITTVIMPMKAIGNPSVAGEPRLTSGFDSLNASFHSNWPFGPSYVAVRDPVRGYVFVGSGGGVFITDSSMSARLGEIRTRGVVWSLHYDATDSLLYVAAGRGGLEIWRIGSPSSPARLSVAHAPGEFRYVYVSPKGRAYVAAGSHVHTFDVSTPASPSLIGSYTMPTGAYALTLAKFERRIYVAARDSGILVLRDGASGPTLIRRIYEGLQSRDVEIYNYSPNFKDGSLTLYALNRTSSGNYVVSTYDILSGGTYSGMTLVLPNGLVARDMAFGGGYLWIVSDQPDSALIKVRVGPEDLSFKKIPTTGAGYSVRTSGEQLLMAMGDRGVARFRIMSGSVAFVDSITLDSIANLSYFIVLNGPSRSVLATGTEEVLVNRRCFNLTTTSSGTNHLLLERGDYVPSRWAHTVSMGSMVITGCGADSLFSADMSSTGKMASVNIGSGGSMEVLSLKRAYPGDTVYMYASDANSENTLVGGYYVNPIDGSLTLRSLYVLDTVRSIGALEIFGNYAYNFMYDWNGIRDRTLRIYRLPDFTPVDSLDYIPPSADTLGFCGGFPASPVASQHVAVSGDRMLLLVGCGSDITYQGELLLVMFDISDPESVSIRDYAVVGGNVVLSEARFSLEVKGDRAYVLYKPSYASSFHMSVYDLSGPMVRLYDGPVPVSGSDYVANMHLIGDTLYAGTGGDVRIFAINSASDPDLLNTYDTPGWAEDVEVRGNYAFVAEKDAWGPDLLIFDVSGSQPDLVGSLDVMGEAEGLNVVNDTVYLALGYGGVAIIDATDKSSPALVGTYDTPGYAHDVLCDCGYLFASGLLFVADGDSLIALDIGDPTNPTFYEGYGAPLDGSRIISVAVDGMGGKAYVGLDGPSHGMIIVDVSTVPFTYVGEFSDSWGDAVSSIWPDVLNGVAYLAYGSAGLDVVDISDPTSPNLLGYWYALPMNSRDVFVSSDGLVYHANEGYGFEALSFPLWMSPQLEKYYTLPSGPRSVWVEGERTYVAGATAGLQVYRIDGSVRRDEPSYGFPNIRTYTDGRIILSGEGEVLLRIFTPSGRVVHSERLHVSGDREVRVALPTGVYFLKAVSSGRTSTTKFIVR